MKESFFCLSPLTKSRELVGKALLTLAILLLSNPQSALAQLKAEVVDNDGWAKGNYVEIGINSRGAYGANTFNRPTDFHDNRERDNNLFGFIANPQKDDWVDYDGDYFTPGAPEEGFTIEIDGVNYNNNNAEPTIQIPGEVVSSSVFTSDCFEDYAQIVWTGEVNGLSIRRFYSITEDGLFIQMITNITNVTSSTKNDVYFLHNVDPDNNQSLSGTFQTNNEIISQASSPTDKVCLVKASQNAMGTTEDMDGSHVSLYANDERARISFGGFNNRNASIVWNGAGLSSTEGDVISDDVAISIAFNLGDIAPSESMNFTYYYILEEVDESFDPIIVNIVPVNPSICESDDGKFVLSGLSPGETYSISYDNNTVPVAAADYIADTDGHIEILNLTQGSYTNFTISFTGCDTTIASDFELTDPPVYFNATTVNPTSCIIDDGKLIFNDLIPFTSYQISYNINSIAQPESEYTSDAVGTIEITGLGPAIYNNVSIRYKSCSTTSDLDLAIAHSDTPVFSLSKFDPFTCDGTEGYIRFSGLMPNTEHTVSYTDDGIAVSETITSSGAGIININGLNVGTYSNFELVRFGCIAENNTTINLNGPLSPILDTVSDKYYCDEDHDFLISNVDLSIYDNEVLNGLSASGFTVSYHNSEDNAINNLSVNKTSYTTTGESDYTIYARVTNNSTLCYSYVPIIFNVDIPAKFQLEEDVICLNLDDTPNTAEFDLPIINTYISELEYTFIWYLDGSEIIGETTNSLTVREPGSYEVLVTNKITGCEIIESVEIIPSGRPKLYEINITSDHFSENDIVEITAEGHGIYIYSMDGQIQDSPIFENITPGFHTFCIIDTQGCGTICEDRIIIDYMKYFTPNNDNENDEWRIIGSEFLSNAEIHIFDRFGKLLTSVDPNGGTWDGYYNGVMMPSTDYWFLVEFDDYNNVRRSFKANFSLIVR